MIRLESALAFGLLLTSLSCGVSIEDHSRLVEEAGICSAGETCVVAEGGSGCACPAAVIASRKEEVEASARSVNCNGVQVKCAVPIEPACVSGRCVSTKE